MSDNNLKEKTFTEGAENAKEVEEKSEKQGFNPLTRL